MPQTWEYTIVPLNISVTEGDPKAGAKITGHFSALINDQATHGWEYYSFEVLPVTVNPGCMMFGTQARTSNYWCVVFRKPVERQPDRAQAPALPVKIREVYSAPPSLPGRAAPPPQRAAKYYYLNHDSETTGPVTVGEMKQLLQTGVIGQDALVCSEGGEKWTRLAETIALA